MLKNVKEPVAYLIIRLEIGNFQSRQQVKIEEYPQAQ